MCMYICLYVPVCVCAYMRMRMCKGTDVCVCMGMCVYVYVHGYVGGCVDVCHKCMCMSEDGAVYMYVYT